MIDGPTYVVDDQRNGRHIDSASENIGGDEDLGITTAEGVDNSITLATFDTTGERCNSMAFSNHALFDLDSRCTSLPSC